MNRLRAIPLAAVFAGSLLAAGCATKAPSTSATQSTSKAPITAPGAAGATPTTAKATTTTARKIKATEDCGSYRRYALVQLGFTDLSATEKAARYDAVLKEAETFKKLVPELAKAIDKIAEGVKKVGVDGQKLTAPEQKAHTDAGNELKDWFNKTCYA